MSRGDPFFERLFWRAVGVPDALTRSHAVVAVWTSTSDGRRRSWLHPIHPSTPSELPIAYIRPPYLFGSDDGSP